MARSQLSGTPVSDMLTESPLLGRKKSRIDAMALGEIHVRIPLGDGR